MHRWFANKSCPGDWLYSRHGEIARITTERLQADKKGGCEEMGCPYWKNGKCTKTTPNAPTIKVGDLVKITGTKYYGGETIPDWVRSQYWYVYEIRGDRAVINRNQKGGCAIMSPINVKYLKKV